MSEDSLLKNVVSIIRLGTKLLTTGEIGWVKSIFEYGAMVFPYFLNSIQLISIVGTQPEGDEFYTCFGAT